MTIYVTSKRYDTAQWMNETSQYNNIMTSLVVTVFEDRYTDVLEQNYDMGYFRNEIIICYFKQETIDDSDTHGKFP